MEKTISNLVPFNKPYFPESAIDYVREVARNGHFSGDGKFTRDVARFISELHIGSDVLMTTSCTHALEMCSLILDLRPGDEVILPSYTFTSAAIAIANFGAIPVFVDVDIRTKNIDVEMVNDAVSKRTKAISFVNYAGVPADINGLREVCLNHEIALIEDNAHGLGATGREGRLGNSGDFSTYSFHETKNFQCGEGGALVINNPKYLESAEIIREKGTNRSRFFRGSIDKYQWVSKGSSYLPSELLMAVLHAQLLEFDQIQVDRLKTWNYYNLQLSGWAAENDFTLPFQDDESNNIAHMFYLVAPSLEVRQDFIDHMRSSGVSVVFHYQDLGTSEGGTRLGKTPFFTPVSKMLSDRLIRLPLWFGISNSELDRVVSSVLEFKKV